MSSTQKRDYYEVLLIDKTASVEEIKKSYKKLAVKWHPDKNLDNRQEANEKFRQISQAYQILSDEEKRKKYDTYGFDDPKTSTKGYKFTDANDIFNMFFKNYGGTSFFQGATSNSGTTGGTRTYYKFSDSNGSGYRYAYDQAGTSSASSAYEKYADLLRGKTTSTSQNQRFQTGQQNKPSNENKQQQKLPPKGHALKQVHHVTRRMSDGSQSTIKRTTLTHDDGTKEITEQNLDGTNKKTHYVLGGTKKAEQKQTTGSTSTTYASYTKKQTEPNTSSQTKTQYPTNAGTRQHVYTSSKVYYADGTEAPVSSSAYSSYGYPSTSSNLGSNVTRRTVYKFK